MSGGMPVTGDGLIGPALGDGGFEKFSEQAGVRLWMTEQNCRSRITSWEDTFLRAVPEHDHQRTQADGGVRTWIVRDVDTVPELRKSTSSCSEKAMKHVHSSQHMP